MIHTINETHFQFPNQTSVYKGKVREVYTIGDELLVMIASDRLSAFDDYAQTDSLQRTNLKSDCYANDERN